MSVCPGSLWEKVQQPTSYRYAWKTRPQVFGGESPPSAHEEAKVRGFLSHAAALPKAPLWAVFKTGSVWGDLKGSQALYPSLSTGGAWSQFSANRNRQPGVRRRTDAASSKQLSGGQQGCQQRSAVRSPGPSSERPGPSDPHQAHRGFQTAQAAKVGHLSF